MIYQDQLDTEALEQYAAALNSRAKTMRAPGRLSAIALRDRIFESGGCCEWCGESLVQAAFELDHVKSLRQGGANSAGNLVVACPGCNRRKGQKHPARFAAEIFGETHVETDLIKKILTQHGIESAQQLSLFGENEKSVLSSIDIDGSAAEVSPYRWTE